MHADLKDFIQSIGEMEASLTDHGYLAEQLKLQAVDILTSSQFTGAYFQGVTDALVKLLEVRIHRFIDFHC